MAYIEKQSVNNDKSPIIVLDKSAADRARQNIDMKVIDLELDVYGEPVQIYIGIKEPSAGSHFAKSSQEAPQNGVPATLTDIVPPARSLCTKLTSAVIQTLRKEGTTVACHKGCSACCRYLVPVTIPEAYQLMAEVQTMAPANRRFMDESCLLAARCILATAPKSFIRELTSPKESKNTDFEQFAELKDISNWYSQFNLPCPFLLDDICTIYKQRPLACREHLVIGSPSDCKVTGTKQAQVVPMPVSILEALAQLTAELVQTNTKAIMLPFVQAWCYDNPEYSRYTWPALQLVERFIDILVQLQKQSSNNPNSEILTAAAKN